MTKRQMKKRMDSTKGAHPVRNTARPHATDSAACGSLASELIQQAINIALQEDLGQAGDMTSQALIPATIPAQAELVAREGGVLAGLDLAIASFKTCATGVIAKAAKCEGQIDFTQHKQDGDIIQAGECVLAMTGTARTMLAAERVALNYISHLSGIASLTRLYVEAVQDTKAQISCTRKTTPHLRLFEKYAVRVGGGINHRFGLDDGILIKDNHIVAAGSVTKAIADALANCGKQMRVEVEVDTLAQTKEALAAGAQIILLDNMPLERLRQAIALIDGRAEIEASGGISLENVRAIAASGVDYISVGRLTHSVPNMDFGLDFTI